jgi:hypothetical protein
MRSWLVPLALAGALGSSTGYTHAVYMLTVNEPSMLSEVWRAISNREERISLEHHLFALSL